MLVLFETVDSIYRPIFGRLVDIEGKIYTAPHTNSSLKI